MFLGSKLSPLIHDSLISLTKFLSFYVEAVYKLFFLKKMAGALPNHTRGRSRVSQFTKEKLRETNNAQSRKKQDTRLT